MTERHQKLAEVAFVRGATMIALGSYGEENTALWQDLLGRMIADMQDPPRALVPLIVAVESWNTAQNSKVRRLAWDRLRYEAAIYFSAATGVALEAWRDTEVIE